MGDKKLKKLIFNENDEYQIKIETEEEYKSSVYSDIYDKANSIVDEIINTEKDDNDKFKTKNNIVAFVGDRGTGKSSSMMSFAKKLENENTKYEVLEVIDPSLFEDNNNIVEVLIAKMYSNVDEILKDINSNSNSNGELKRKTLNAFKEVYDALKTVGMSQKDILNGDSFQELVKLSYSSKLKESIMELFSKYLEFKGHKDYSEAYLIIQIDDIDGNIKNAYEMIEQIRKYLIIPNVVILMALKIEQLSDIVKQYYLTEFKLLSDKDKDEVMFEVENMTEKYLDKLIPLDRRLFLDNIKDDDVDYKIEINSTDSEKKEYNSIEECVRTLIYKKTGLLFTKNKFEVSNIIPENLRELHNLIAFLNKLTDVKNTTKENIEMIIKKYDIDIDTKKYFDENSDDYIKFSPIRNDFLLIENLINLNINENEFDEKFIISNEKYIKKGKNGKNGKILEKWKKYDGELKKYIEDLNKIKTVVEGNIKKGKKIKIRDNSEKYDKKIHLKNIKKFKTYFVKVWAKTYLNGVNSKILTKINDIEIVNKNKYIVNIIKEILGEKKEGFSDKIKSEINDITSITNNKYNISFGDVHFMINLLEKVSRDKQTTKMSFAIKTYFSIILFEKYLLIKEKVEDNDQSELEDYHILLGGSVYNPNFAKILPDIKNKDIDNNSRQEMDIKYKKFIKLLKNDDELLENIINDVDKFKDYSKDKKEATKDMLLVFEVINNLIVDTRIGIKIGKRNDIGIYYNKNEVNLNNRNKVKINIFQFMFNNTFNKGVYENFHFANIENDYHKIIDNAKKIGYESIYENLKTDFFVGNLEIMEDIYRMKISDYEPNDNTIVFSKFKALFEHLKKYSNNDEIKNVNFQNNYMIAKIIEMTEVIKSKKLEKEFDSLFTDVENKLIKIIEDYKNIGNRSMRYNNYKDIMDSFILEVEKYKQDYDEDLFKKLKENNKLYKEIDAEYGKLSGEEKKKLKDKLILSRDNLKESVGKIINILESKNIINLKE